MTVLIDEARREGWCYVDRFIREPAVAIETIHPAIAVEQPVALTLTLTLTKGRGAG